MMETMKSGGRREITLPADTLLRLLDDSGSADAERLRELTNPSQGPWLALG